MCDSSKGLGCCFVVTVVSLHELVPSLFSLHSATPLCPRRAFDTSSEASPTHMPSGDNQMLLTLAQPYDIQDSQRTLMVLCLFLVYLANGISLCCFPRACLSFLIDIIPVAFCGQRACGFRAPHFHSPFRSPPFMVTPSSPPTDGVQPFSSPSRDSLLPP